MPTLTRVDSWTLAVSISRIFLFATFMTIAAVIPELQRAWGLSATAAGSIVTGFTITYALSLFGFAWAADHLGAKRTVASSAIASGVTSALFGLFAHDYLSALLLYSLVGLAQGGIYTPLIMLFAERTERTKRGAAMGWLIASTSVGYAASLALSGIGLFIGGWRAAFVITGFAPLIGTVILLYCLRNTENRIHPRAHETGLFDQMVRNRNARLLTAGYTAHTWELLGMWAWMPAFLAASFTLGGWSAAATESSAFASAVMHLIGASAAFSMGRLSDRLGRKRVLFGVAALAAILSFSIGWLIMLPAIILVALGILYGFATIGDSPVLTTALTEVVDPGYLGAVLAVRSVLGFGAGAIAPLAVGGIIDLLAAAGAAPATVWGMAFGALGIGGAIAAAMAARLRDLH
ncbi:MAG: MFS transporter [Hyphomicrobiales bacterium]|nr:MFS transporter [Hyphomicrobiales bacterium]